MKLTDLEREVLQLVADGADPWRGKTSATRTTSQALQRLQRKGAIVSAFEHGHRYAVTDAGRAALGSAGDKYAGKAEHDVRGWEPR